jgi:MarR family transcriptional repressor of emrRAB
MTGGDSDRAPPRGEPAQPDEAADLVRTLTKLSNLVGRPFFSHFADRYDLTRNDVGVLLTLTEMQEGAAHELCRVTGMHPMNVSRSVARLRRQGRISERSDPDNRRRKILTPTPVGWELAGKLRPHVKAMGDFLCASLTELEADFLGKLLRRLIERLQAVDLNSPILLDQEALQADPPPPGGEHRIGNGSGRKPAAISARRGGSPRPAGSPRR